MKIVASDMGLIRSAILIFVLVLTFEHEIGFFRKREKILFYKGLGICGFEHEIGFFFYWLEKEKKPLF